MTHPDSSHREPSFPGSAAIDQVAFSRLYDQYAPALLGVIAATVRDEAEAIRLLEITFVKISAQFGQSRPASQPLFVWLLSIARSVASEAAKNSETAGPAHLQLTSTGQVDTVVINNLTAPVAGTQNPASSPVSELLDAVLYKNCTPEEAVSAFGLPVASARQQFRLAMQQLRASGTV